jgi:hypothetical protein
VHGISLLANYATHLPANAIDLCEAKDLRRRPAVGKALVGTLDNFALIPAFSEVLIVKISYLDETAASVNLDDDLQ